MTETHQVEVPEPATRVTGTRARLMRAAVEAIEEAGYGGASVAAIAARAGVAAGTLYRHFPSKPALLVELFRHAAERQLEDMYAASAAQPTFARKLDAVLTAYARSALANRRLTWALVYEPVDPLVDAERLVYRRRYREEMADLIRGGIAGGEFPVQDADLSAAAVVGAMSEALVGPISPLSPERSDEEEIVAGIVGLCHGAVEAMS